MVVEMIIRWRRGRVRCWLRWCVAGVPESKKFTLIVRRGRRGSGMGLAWSLV